MIPYNFPYNRPRLSKQEMKKAYRAARLVEKVGRDYWYMHEDRSPMEFLYQEVPALKYHSDTIHFFESARKGSVEDIMRHDTEYAKAMYTQYKTSIYRDVREQAKSIFCLSIRRKYQRKGYLP